MRFDDKVALITGAARGIGACVALQFAKEGANIVALDITQDIAAIDYSLGNVSDLEKVVNDVKKMGRNAIGVIADVSKSAQVKIAVDKAIVEFGKIDILVNNAGIILRSPFVNSTEEQIRAVIDVNINGCIFCCQHVIPHMARQKYGKIVNISSGAGLRAEPGLSIYSATKYAVLGLTEALAAELAYYNINVNAVCPTGVRTGLNKGRQIASTADNYFRREITVEDIAAAVLFLASEEARNITSTWIPVTAGVEKKTPSLEPYFTV